MPINSLLALISVPFFPRPEETADRRRCRPAGAPHSITSQPRAGKLSFAAVSQVKIYGTQSRLPGRRDALSDVIHGCVVDALQYPTEKRAHRFFALAPEDFRYPPGRSDDYTIIEISLFEGRSVAAKKKLYALLFERCETQIGIAPVDLEITLTETPRHNWGIRGAPGDELGLAYKIEV